MLHKQVLGALVIVMIFGNINELDLSVEIDLSHLSIYHFLHIDNLESIFSTGSLYSDGYIRDHGVSNVCVAMSRLKDRRLTVAIPQFPNLTVGNCVPFYFCTKSVMLYVISRADSPDLSYRDGQNPIVYFRFNFDQVWEWAKSFNLQPILTTGNASAAHTEAFIEKNAVRGLDWNAINETRWGGDDLLKHRKAAELLVEERVSADLISEIGVIDESYRQQVAEIVSRHPQFAGLSINVRREWYF